MKPALFISYSRRQTPFVDYLAERLRRNGHPLWLDYRSPVPAKPWFEQILSGIKEADALLLVVSKDSIASKNVTAEWQQALELEKRTVLLIFEAVSIPAELQNCEWVDFRGSFTKSMKKLENLLAQPVSTPKSLPPQSGFKAPLRFWLAVILSIIVLLGSIPTWWVVFVPLILVPLPWQIYRRNYNLNRVIATLLFVPFFLFLTSYFFPLVEGSFFDRLNTFFSEWYMPTALASWTLLIIFLTPVMQRRAAPEAAVPSYANPEIVSVQRPRPVQFFIDHASEDISCAEEFRRVLEQEGHHLVGPSDNPEAIFVLLSTYKRGTEYDPDHQAIFPVLLQTVQNVDPKLQRIQWIDFGNGIHHISRLAKLLPEPERLLRAFAMPPIGSREIFPLVVNGLQYFFLVVGVLAEGFLLASLLAIGDLASHGSSVFELLAKYFVPAMNLMLLFGVGLYALKGLRTRRGGTSTFYPLFVLTIFYAVIVYFTIMSSILNSTGDPNLIGLVKAAGYDELLLVSLLVLLVFWLAFALFLARWRSLRRRWLPRHAHGPVDHLESALLLYTPMQRHEFILHIIFHAVLLIFYFLFMLASNRVLGWSAFGYLVPVFLVILWRIHRLARRGSTQDA